MNITMTIEQYEKIKRLADFADYFIENQEPSGEQYFSDLEEICAGKNAIHHVDQQLQFS